MDKISYEIICNEAEAKVFDWNGANVTVTPVLSMEDMMLFVDTVVRSCFNSINGEYHPEIKDFLIRSCILELYANFELPEDMRIRYNIVYATDITYEVMKYINQAQFDAITMAIDRKIEERININVAKFEKEREDTLSVINELLDTIRSVFDGIDENAVKDLVGALANTQFDMDKLVEKVVSENAKALADKEAVATAQ